MSFGVKGILVESESVVEVLSWNAYQKMRLKEHALSKASSLCAFANHSIEVREPVAEGQSLQKAEFVS
ncbi:hypothetical protein PVK06_025131 [Gossypium arboreum]|uniref:Uncharacterized protein n=1 Tax=Gossypium arboreum TaxID=29729 RepID=A0ABR0PFL2_GOSAR|nr:hypothetical protein PVK06_025131 [Gossypium arboreum]